MRAWIVLIAYLGLACATTSGSREGCVGRADDAYRHCLHPYVVAETQEEPTITRTDTAQACREAHQSALLACEPPPAAPHIDLTRSSTSAR
ncbi:MAG: hypothetical protein HYV07_05950 [Deltaproteobacteria bacterium]|nr:hypothetical protein [Deltaproteobacteria bacterium]